MATKYSEDHEWITVNKDLGTVGITDHAQAQLGDIVFVELPEIGSKVEAGAEAGVVESVKAASDLFTPVSGEVVEVNDVLEEEPSLANSDPTGTGWFFKLKLSDTAELDDLMDEARYKDFIAE